MITREDIQHLSVEQILKLITAEREQYQALVKAAVAWASLWKDETMLIHEQSRQLHKTVKPFLKPSPSERLEELAAYQSNILASKLREIAAAVREMEK